MPLGLAVIGILTALLAAVLTADRLPSLAVLTDYRPKVPMHVYTADGLLIGEFGEERRSVVRIDDFPEPMTQAILAAEDDRFYEHSGVDVSGIVAGGGRQPARRRPRPGREHHHHAAGAQLLPDPRAQLRPQDL